MPIKTNLNQFPYFDDYDETKDYYRVLFRPSVSVQTRELNQLQNILAQQLERFADNIFVKGSTVAGINFAFYKPYAYVKLSDLALDGDVVNPQEYVGMFATDEGTGLKAYIVNYADGFEASDPDLKTIYVKYVNSGDDFETTQFTSGNNITIQEGSNTIFNIVVINGGTGFSNSDTLVVTSAVLINVASGSFVNNENLINGLGANVDIIGVDTNTVPGKTILNLKPRNSDLTDSSVTSSAWSFNLFQTVTNATNTVSGTLESFYGSGTTGRVLTNAVGSVQDIVITNRGQGYHIIPNVTIKTANASATVGTLNLVAENYVAKIKIPALGDAIGNGYGFGVSEGIVYDSGSFLRVEPQTTIISKYSESPTDIAVGFLVNEELIDSNIDTSLLDNALGTENEDAPGADRLKLTPRLTTLSKEAASGNNDFFTLVEWNDGNPYKQNRTSTYSRIGDAIAQNIYDQSGNFVMDAFQITSESSANTQRESTHYTAVIDPGQAYINGRKVQTLSNYKISLNKALDTSTANNTISLNYGNYIRINEVGGSFDVSEGAQASLYNLPRTLLSNTNAYAGGTISPLGAAIGTARMRGIEHENGTPGLPTTVYRLYLFDIEMNAGENFRDVKAVYYDDTYDAIGDVVTEYSPSINANVAIIKETRNNKLLFYSGVESLKNSNTSTYNYRTTDTVNTAVATATSVLDLSAGSEYFPHGTDRELSSIEMQQIVFVPQGDDLIDSTDLTGTCDIATSTVDVTGSGTNFFADFQAGDYIHFQNGGSESVRRIVAIGSSTTLTLDSAPNYTNAAAEFNRVFPINIPVPLGLRQGITANVDATGQITTIQFGYSNGDPMTFVSGPQIDTTVSYDVQRQDVQSALKSAVRNVYVKINLANNAAGTNGPWCLGVPDIFRLRAVYVGNSSIDEEGNDVVNDFYVDHNQNANYLGLGYLYRKPNSALTLNSTDHLLVCIDYSTRDSTGYYDTRSYLRTADNTSIQTLDSSDFTTLNSATASHSWEVPEVYTYDNHYYDCYNQFDFRPAADGTATPNANSTLAPYNPSETVAFTGLSKFPKPNGIMRTQIEQYLGRVDDVYIGDSGNIYILKGIPSVDPRKRLTSNHPKDSLKLNMLHVPPYPNITKTVKNNMEMIINTGVANERLTQQRLLTKQIEPIITSTNLQTSQPMVYTMEDIGNLERRIIDLEYYVSLSVLETNIANKIIPSSVDPALDRFKYGFFADNFATDIYSDLASPEYAATLEAYGDMDFGYAANPFDDGRASVGVSDPNSQSIQQPTKLIQKATNLLVPPKYIWSMRHFTENLFYTDEEVIRQGNATKTVGPCIIVLADATIIGEAYYTSINRTQSRFYTEGLAGVINIYFQTYGVYGAKISVYAPDGTLVKSTAASRADVVNLSSQDKSFLSTNEHAEDYYKAISTQGFDTNFTRNTGTGVIVDYGIGTGKFVLNSNVGGKYTVVIDYVDGLNSNWKFLATYPSISAVDSAVVNTPDCDPNPPKYTGTLKAGAFTITTWSCSNQFRVSASNYKAFVLEATGLKPDTLHTLYMDSVEWPHTINITSQLIRQAQYDPSRRGGSRGGSIDFLFSKYRRVNELSRYLGQSRAKLYEADGSRTQATYIKSNKNGQCRFLVFYPHDIAAWFSQDFNATAYAEQGIANNYITSGSKRYKQGYFFGKLGKPTYGSSGYTTILLTNGKDSGAIKVFAQRTPNKTIPNDPKGSI